MLVIGKKCIRHPDSLGEVTCQGHAVGVVVGEREAIVSPILIQVDGDGVILKQQNKNITLTLYIVCGTYLVKYNVRADAIFHHVSSC